MVIEGWNSKTAKFLNNSVSGMIDEIGNNINDNKIKNNDEGTAVYLNISKIMCYNGLI